ncbi:IS3 family transposase [Actinokineospora pegani]|uniref:IS3 family transposase n=1 Tax=Actinokineospora pegani TaxID=2654637 RepID=UPI0038B3043A
MLSARIAEVFADSDVTCGYRRLHAGLAAHGVVCGPEPVRQIMREQASSTCVSR